MHLPGRMRIACILADGFDDAELAVPRDRLRAAGHEVVVGLRREAVLRGARSAMEAGPAGC